MKILMGSLGDSQMEFLCFFLMNPGSESFFLLAGGGEGGVGSSLLHRLLSHFGEEQGYSLAAGFSLQWLLFSQGTGSRACGFQ